MSRKFGLCFIALVACIAALGGVAWAQSPPVIDSTTSGAWIGTYGQCAYVLGAYDNPFKGCETAILPGTTGTVPPYCQNYTSAGGGSPDVLDCEYDALDLDGNGDQDLFYNVYNGCNSAVLTNPDGTYSGKNSLWFNTPQLNYTISGVPAGTYRVAVYVMSWDSAARRQNMEVCVGAVCSFPDPVGNHVDGIYGLYEVTVAAGETVKVIHTNTAGANAVAQGVFFDPIPGPLTCANGKACLTGTQDLVTRGNWTGTYGSAGYVLFNRPIATNGTAATTYTASAGLTVGPINGRSWYWTDTSDYACGYAAAYIWNCNDASGRALENPGGCGGVGQCAGGYTTSATWDDTGELRADGPDLMVDVKVDLPGVWKLSFYAVDYDSNNRQETFHLYQYHSLNPIFAPVNIGTYSQGKYVTYTLTGPFEVTLRVEKTAGANAIISGIFVDPAEGYDCAGNPPPPDCSTNPGDFCTYTIGGWGAGYHGANPGTIRNDNWNTVYPPIAPDLYGDLVISGSAQQCKSITFTEPTAVEIYMPCGGQPSSINKSFTDPTCDKKGQQPQKNTLMSQVVGLRLNVDYSCAGVLDAYYPNPDSPICLGDLAITSGPFMGDTVYEFLEKAEDALLCGTFDPGLTAADYNWTATAINENFDGCDESNGFLECPDPGGGDECGVSITKSVAMEYPGPVDRNNDSMGPDAYPGEKVTFTLNAEAGTSDLTNVAVSDVLPSFTLAGVSYDYYVGVSSCTFNPNTGQSCSYNDATNTLTVNLGNLAAGSHVTMTYTAYVNLMAPPVTLATNTATVTASTATGTCSDSDSVGVWIVPGPPVHTTNDIGTPGYWCNHIDQGKQNAFDADEINRWLSNIEMASRWWSEFGGTLVDNSLPPTFQNVLGIVCGKDNAGSDKDKLERHLLTLWLNVATFHVGTNITLEAICEGMPYPAGTNKNWTVGDVITYAESELLAPGSTGHGYLFWKDVIDAINNGNAPGFNGCP